MAKRQKTFMDKIAKGTGPRGNKCPTCGEIIQPIKKVVPYKTDSGSWRYKESMAEVCKCNAKEELIDQPIV